MATKSGINAGPQSNGSDEVRQFGDRLRQLRVECGMSQVDLADAADLARPTVSKIERGLQDVTVVVLRRLARALGVEPAELLKAPDRG